MSTATMNIAEFFEKQWILYNEEVISYESRKTKCADAELASKKRLKQLQNEYSKKEMLKKQASENGLDTSPLEKDILRLRSEMDALQKQQDEFQQLASEPEPTKPYNDFKIKHFVDLLCNHECLDAEVLPSLQAVAPLISVMPEDLEIDDNGKVVKASIRLADCHIGEVNISPEHSRYAKSFTPKSLSWLAASNGAQLDEYRWHNRALNERGAMTKLFIIEDKQAVLFTAVYEFNYRVTPEATPDTLCLDEDDGPFIIASTLLDDAIEDVGGEIRLDQSYQDCILARICEVIVAQTLDHPLWAINTEWPASDKVFASIKDDLLLVVAAPWSDHVHGDWAKLKYTLENGERPRLWRKEHVGQYGIRLRTRDHTWLLGEIFIDHSQQPGQAGDPIVMTGNPNTRRIGRMSITIHECQ